MSEERETAGEPSLADFGRTIRKRWLSISVTSLSLGVLLTLVSFAIPPTYEAVTTLLPVPSSDRMSALGVLGTRLADLSIPNPLSATPAASYPRIVQSRRLMEQVLNMRCQASAARDSVPLIDLIHPRGEGPKREEEALKSLQRQVDIDYDRRSGIIAIVARAKYPTVAAAIANALATNLQDFMIDVAASQAGKKKKFIEGRLYDTQTALTQRENELRAFRERNLRIGNSPRLQIDEGRLVRALREQEEIYLTLSREYEMAKVEEHQDVAPLVVVDTAIPPSTRHSPSRRMLALLGLVVGAAAGGVMSIIRERR